MDIFTLVVIAIIVFNFLGPIFKAIAAAIRRAASGEEQQARSRLSQALQQSAATTVDASRAAELDRLRRALLASSGLSEVNDSAPTVQQSASAPPYVVTQSLTTPPTQPGAPLASATPAATLARPPAARTGSRRQRRLSATTIAPQRTAMAVPAVAGDTLASLGSLMTLESAASAFEPLPAPDVSVAGVRAASAARLALLQRPNAAMDLVIAAAIIGPCAATRPIGHTPGGW